jgi:lipid-binding SYLF domain-containing protein
MKHVRKTCTTLAAAVALACGAAYAQEGVDGHDRIESQDPAIPAHERDLEERQQVAELGREGERSVEDLEDARDIVERRDELVQMADETIEELRSEDAAAAELLDKAHGYAVFDTTKGGLIVTGAGGTGVARETATGNETFMHVGAAGIGIGAGLENYRMVVLFEDEQTYQDFVAGQWDGSVSAQAAAGEQGAAAEEQFVDGIRVYRITDAGLIAQVDVSGMRFWRSDRLNDEV